MAKVTVHGGASNKYDPPAPAREEAPEPEVATPEPEVVPEVVPEAAPAVAPAEEGGEQPSPGTSTSTSSGKPLKSNASSEASRPKRARTTESH